MAICSGRPTGGAPARTRATVTAGSPCERRLRSSRRSTRLPTAEVLCSTAPAKRMKIVMDELPLALALDPDMQTRFPAHLSRNWARKEQALLSAWLVKTENVRTLQVSNWRANS